MLPAKYSELNIQQVPTINEPENIEAVIETLAATNLEVYEECT